MQGGEATVKATGKGKEAPPLKEREEKGGLLIRDLWTEETDSIYNMCVVKRQNKKNYLNPCLNEYRNFTPLLP